MIQLKTWWDVNTGSDPECTIIGLSSQMYNLVFLKHEINHIAWYIKRLDQFWPGAAPDIHPQHLGFLFLWRFVLTQVHILSCWKNLHVQYLQHRRQITARTHKLFLQLLLMSFISLSPVYSPKGLFHSTAPSQPTPQRNADARMTPYMHIHTHTLFLVLLWRRRAYCTHFSSRLTQTRSGFHSWLTVCCSGLCWSYCQADDCGNFS